MIQKIRYDNVALTHFLCLSTKNIVVKFLLICKLQLRLAYGRIIEVLSHKKSQVKSMNCDILNEIMKHII